MDAFKVLILFVSLLKIATGSGVMWIRMLTFINPGGNGDNGHPCDGRWLFNGSPCDHKITLCVDRVAGTSSINSCTYGRADTGEIPNANTITFSTRAGRLHNPFTFALVAWPGSVKIKVMVWDIDDNNDDFVDFIQAVFRAVPNTGVHRLVLRRRTRLTIDVKVLCNPNYYGPQCSTYCRPRNNDYMGHYSCARTTGAKICARGWRGTNCNDRINLCVACQQGTCDNSATAYQCSCDVGFTGVNCQTNIDECASNPCKNGGTCMEFIGRYLCACREGWRNPNCDMDRNECIRNTCRNNGTCTNTPGSFRCDCHQGWEGTHCDDDINECVSGDRCHNSASCVNVPGTFECVCADGLSGDLCEDIDECATANPCSENSTCLNEHGSFRCFCPEGWTGQHCDVDINECKDDITNPCQANSTCENLEGSFVCLCPVGMTGTYCDVDIDECETLPCWGNSTCLNQVSSFVCWCAEGYAGSLCDTNIDECASSPCMNNASCVDGVNGFSCVCQAGWSGDICDTELDECQGNDLPVMVNVHGDLGIAGLEAFNQTLLDILSETFSISQDNIRLLVTSEYWADVENKPMTTLQISVYVHDSQICRDDVTDVINKGHVLGKAVDLPSSIAIPKSSSKVGNLQDTRVLHTKKNWISSNWYILAGIAGIFVALVAISIVIYKHRRSTKNNVIAGRDGSLYQNGSLSMPEDPGDESCAIASLSFDNVLYTTFQPQRHAPPLAVDVPESVCS